MKILDFTSIAEFVRNVSDEFKILNEYEDITIVAKYEEARNIIRELICLGFNIRSIVSLEPSESKGCDREYIVSIVNIDEYKEIWCELMVKDNGYITNDSPITYILDNCSSKVIPYCKGKNVYEVSIIDNSDEDHDYTVNGKHIDKEIFDEYISKFTSDKVKKSEDNDENGSSTYDITIKCNLDMGDVEKIIEGMERRMVHIQEMIDKINSFKIVSGLNRNL